MAFAIIPYNTIINNARGYNCSNSYMPILWAQKSTRLNSRYISW